LHRELRVAAAATAAASYWAPEGLLLAPGSAVEGPLGAPLPPLDEGRHQEATIWLVSGRVRPGASWAGGCTSCCCRLLSGEVGVSRLELSFESNMAAKLAASGLELALLGALGGAAGELG